jgi:hypothetical protein
MTSSNNGNGNGASAAAPKREPLAHFCHCGAWGSFGHDAGTKEERWYCRAHDPCGSRGAR